MFANNRWALSSVYCACLRLEEPYSCSWPCDLSPCDPRTICSTSDSFRGKRKTQLYCLAPSPHNHLLNSRASLWETERVMLLHVRSRPPAWIYGPEDAIWRQSQETSRLRDWKWWLMYSSQWDHQIQKQSGHKTQTPPCFQLKKKRKIKTTG